MVAPGERERAFLMRRRVGYLATANREALPRLVPVCFTLGDDSLYTAIDEKPKRGRKLRRLSDIVDNPRVEFLADHYVEEWSELGWVMLGGRAEILDEGPEFEHAVELLKKRYVQYAGMRLSPVIAVRIDRVRFWGSLDN
jgi:PPOX class probable F420-dependent enzyme